VDTNNKKISMMLYNRFRFPVHINWDHFGFGAEYIEGAIKTDTDPEGFSRVFKHPVRILSVNIRSGRPEVIGVLLAKMNGDPAPLLISLQLNTISKTTGGSHVPELELLRLPALHALSLQGVAVPWGADFLRGPHLRRLELSYDELNWKSLSSVAEPVLPTMLATLAGLPNLEVLELSWYLPKLVTGSPLQVVHMSHLRKLTLSGSVVTCVAFMQHLYPARLVVLDVFCNDHGDSIAAALWDVVSRYWIPNTAAPPTAEVIIWDETFSVELVGVTARGEDQELTLGFWQDEPLTGNFAALRDLGPRLARVQTPAQLVLNVRWREYDKLDVLVRGLSGHGPRLHLCGPLSMECFLDALEGEGDEDERETIFSSLSELTVEGCRKLEHSHEIDRLCRGLERRRAMGATELLLLTFVGCPRLHVENVRALLRTYDINLQVLIRN
jgi:hypothetical protein